MNTSLFILLKVIHIFHFRFTPKKRLNCSVFLTPAALEPAEPRSVNAVTFGQDIWDEQDILNIQHPVYLFYPV